MSVMKAPVTPSSVSTTTITPDASNSPNIVGTASFQGTPRLPGSATTPATLRNSTSMANPRTTVCGARSDFYRDGLVHRIVREYDPSATARLGRRLRVLWTALRPFRRVGVQYAKTFFGVLFGDSRPYDCRGDWFAVWNARSYNRVCISEDGGAYLVLLAWLVWQHSGIPIWGSHRTAGGLATT